MIQLMLYFLKCHIPQSILELLGLRSPEGEETLRPPRLDLRSPGIISKHGGFRAPDGDSTRVRERERHGGFDLLAVITY